MQNIGRTEVEKRYRRGRRLGRGPGASLEPQGGLEPLEPRLMFSATTVPVYHSLPGAAAAIYLDFDGHFEPQWGSYRNISSPAYDIDDNPSVYSSTELANIHEIWARVAEDFAPFKINVTTENPGSFANGQALRVVIGGSSYDWFGSGAGGVSYRDTFTNSVVNTVYVFPKQLSNGNAKYVADAVSHETGHALGLEHQSRWNGGVKIQEHHSGADGWAPIMGNAYSQAMGTWHNGQNSSGAVQDDMAVIARAQNGFGYRGDDHGNTSATATAMSVQGASVSAAGIIERSTDVDAFHFDTGAGMVTLELRVAAFGPNLDARLSLYDSSGRLISTVDPSTSQGAMMSVAVSAGRYFVHVASNGLYGRVGQYTLSGTIIPVSSAPQPEVAVHHGNSEILDGRQEAIDFGDAPEGQPGQTRTFTVSNQGNGTLTLGSVNLPTGFTLVEPLSTMLAPGASDTFTVQLDTNVVGTRSGTLSFSTNDADEAVFDFPIRGRVNALPPPDPTPPAQPQVSVSLVEQGIGDGQTSAVDFGQAARDGAAPTHTFTVRNVGDAVLTLGSISLPTGFMVVEPLDSAIAAGESDTFTVRLDTASVGVFSGTLSFSTNDVEAPLFDFVIRGTVVGPATQVIPLVARRPMTFTGSDGQLVTVRLRGAGEGFVVLDTGGEAAPKLVLQGTTGRSSLTIRAAGRTELGGILVEGSLRRIRASKVDLSGDLIVTGQVRAVRLGDVAGAADQTLSFGIGERPRPMALSLGRLQDVTISSAGSIKSLRVQSWEDSAGEADLVQASHVGRIRSSGDFEADMSVASLRRMTVGGALDGSEIRASGKVGRVTMGAMRDSQIYAGLSDDVDGLPADVSDFDALSSIRSVRIRGLEDGGEDFRGSTIAAWSVRRARLGGVVTQNEGERFGVATADFRRLSYRRAGDSEASRPVHIRPEHLNGGPDAARSAELPDGDFLIRLF